MKIHLTIAGILLCAGTLHASEVGEVGSFHGYSRGFSRGNPWQEGSWQEGNGVGAVYLSDSRGSGHGSSGGGSARRSGGRHGAPLSGVHSRSPVYAGSHSSHSTYRARPRTSVEIGVYGGGYRYYGPVRPYGYYPRAVYSYAVPYYYPAPVYVPPVYQPPPVYQGVPVYPGEVAPPAPSGSRAVAQVQEKLRKAGYYKGMVDGQMGPATRAAIRTYQIDRGLDVTGKIDQELLSDLGL